VTEQTISNVNHVLTTGTAAVGTVPGGWQQPDKPSVAGGTVTAVTGGMRYQIDTGATPANDYAASAEVQITPPFPPVHTDDRTYHMSCLVEVAAWNANGSLWAGSVSLVSDGGSISIGTTPATTGVIKTNQAVGPATLKAVMEGANLRLRVHVGVSVFGGSAKPLTADLTVKDITLIAQEIVGDAPAAAADVFYRDPADQKFKPLTTLLAQGFPCPPSGIDPATAKIEWGTESFIEFDWAKATVVESTYPPEANLRAVPEANGVRFKWDTFNATLKWSGGFMATVKEGPYASYEVPIRLRPGHSIAGNGRGIRVKANVDVPANMASATVNAISGVGVVTPVAGTSSMVPKQVWATIVNTPQPDYKAPLAADLWTAVVDELATPAPRMRGVLPGSVGFGVYGPALPVYTSAIVSGKPLTNAGGADETTVVTIVAGEMYVHDFGAITQEVVAP
jgi:hypothetical protein